MKKKINATENVIYSVSCAYFIIDCYGFATSDRDDISAISSSNRHFLCVCSVLFRHETRHEQQIFQSNMFANSTLSVATNNVYHCPKPNIWKK